ncbi:MAG: phage virion morphogenesis protein [Porphyromonas sp.]|nr:phage virion morphogenesis protein [Porphyromonas sp.]
MTSDPKEFERLVFRLRLAVEKELNDALPRKVGRQAVQLFRNNFRLGGFQNGTLSKWKPSKREQAKVKTRESKYKTLTSARNHLMNSIDAVPGKGEVSIENPLPYASIHNEGGTLNTKPRITKEMRKFAWVMFYKTLGKRRRPKGKSRKRRKKGSPAPPPLPPEAQKWKALALTKKTHLNIRARIPKRQFIGESSELEELVKKEIQLSIKKISNGISTK